MQLDPDDLWQQALSVVEDDNPTPSFQRWLRNTYPLKIADNELLVAVPNPFARDWLESKYGQLIRSAVQTVAPNMHNVKFVTNGRPESDELAATSDQVADEVEQQVIERLRVSSRTTVTSGQPLNPKYTFDTFVVGNSNRLAHAASMAVAAAPARAYNPLFVYGGVGLGKTHLMQAIAHHVQDSARSSTPSVVYISSETFANEMINAIRDGTTTQFRRRYRHVDVLLVDDIQFLAGKDGTQEEFFHTFNALHEANKQIVLSSDRPPKEIPTLEERLRSRFEWGLISDIQPPDLETRVAILRKKAQVEELNIPDDVLLYIAERIDTNIRELEGALIRLVAFSSLIGQSVTLDVAAEALKDLVPAPARKVITIQYVQEKVAEHFGLEIKHLKVRKRTRALVVPRQIAMYLARELTDHSLPQIGEEFGGRDHTTVLHAYDKISSQKEEDPSLKQTLRELERVITR